MKLLNIKAAANLRLMTPNALEYYLNVLAFQLS